MSEILIPETPEKKLSIGEQFTRTVVEHLAAGDVSVIQDRLYGLTVAMADFAVRGDGAKQIVRFKEYKQETNVTGVPGYETRHHRYAIESHVEAHNSQEWKIDYAIELDTSSGEFWKRIEDKNGISHHRMDDLSFVEIVAGGVKAISARDDLVPVRSQ